MNKKLNECFDFSKPLGKVFIVGLDEGVGKTLLSCALHVNVMLRGRQDCLKSYKIIDEYNKLGYSFSKNFEHLAFSNYDCNTSGTSIPSLKTHRFNPFKAGLYCEDYETTLLPPMSTLFVTECQRPFNAYMWQFVRPEVSGFWESGRQANISAVFDTNRPMQVVNTIRVLCNRFIFLYKKCDEIIKDGICVGNILHVYEFNQWADVEKYIKLGTLQNYEKYDLILDKCYYKNYDSYQCKYLHLKGREAQDYEIEYFPELNTVEDVENFVNDFGLYPPEGYYKKKSEFKKKEEKLSPQEEKDDTEDYCFLEELWLKNKV